MKPNQRVFRPTNPLVYMLLMFLTFIFCLAIFVTGLTIYNLLNKVNTDLSVIFSAPIVGVIGGVSFLYISGMRLILHEDEIEIVSYLDKSEHHLTPGAHRFSQFKHDRIAYKDLRFFGSYFGSDVHQYLRKGTGRLADDIQPYEHDNKHFSVHLNNKLTGMRSLMVFVDERIGLTIMDAELYGHRQTQRILHDLSNRTGLLASGRIEAKYRWSSIWIDIVSALLVFTWIAIVPFLVIEAVWLVNPEAKLTDLGTVMIILLFMGNISSLGIIEGLKSSKQQRVVKDYKPGMLAIGGFTFLCYLITLILFLISIQTTI